MLVKSSSGNSLLTLLQQEGWDNKPFFAGSPFVNGNANPLSVFSPEDELLVVMSDDSIIHTTAKSFESDLCAHCHGGDTDVRSVYKKASVKVCHEDPVKKVVGRKKYY